MMMKRVLSLFVLSCLLFSFVGCSGKSAVQQAVDIAMNAYKDRMPPSRAKKLPIALRKGMVKKTIAIFKRNLKKQGYSFTDADIKYMEKRIKKLLLLK